MNEEEDIRLAEEYCTGKLGDADRVVAETRMESDPGFAQLVRDLRTLLAGVRAEGRMELGEEMSRWEAEHVRREAKMISLRTWAAVGIAASVVLALSLFFWRSELEPKTMALFKSNYQAYPNVVMPTVRGTPRDSSRLARAYQTYDLGEYEKAASLFSNIPEKDAAVYFYLGQCHLALDNTNVAITNFVLCLELKDSFSDQAQWYLALAYLRQGDVIRAKEALEKVRLQQNSYSPRADSILTQL